LKPPILIIDDDISVLTTLSAYLRVDYEVYTASDGNEGLSVFQEALPVAVILDMRMPGMRGLEVLKKIKSIEPNTYIIILTAYGTIEDAVEAIKVGADQFLTKPVDAKALDVILKKAVKTEKIQKKYMLLLEKTINQEDKYILDAQTHKALEIMAKNPDTTVLILGPTGSGKGLLAKHIHEKSSRRDQSFLEINCAGLSENLLESELFGHERGAFTDAKTVKKGLMEVADGGTLFLDEIGEMPLSIQAKVLTALETKIFRRVGGTKNIEVDVRIIAATSANILEKMREGKFREDLYYRLNILPITVPPLVNRKTDILNLTTLFLNEFAGKMNKTIKGLTKDAISLLVNYAWPGNIRELKNVIERATILCEENYITVSHLPAELRKRTYTSDPTETMKLAPIEEVVKQHITAVLAHTKGNKAAAARILKMDYKTLMRKIKKYRIPTK